MLFLTHPKQVHWVLRRMDWEIIVLTLTVGYRPLAISGWWYYGDAQRFWGVLSSFLVYRWVGFRSRPNAPHLQNVGAFWKIWPKKPKKKKKNTCFFASNLYIDASQNHTFQGIEMIEIQKSTLSSPYCTKVFEESPSTLLVKLHFFPGIPCSTMLFSVAFSIKPEATSKRTSLRALC